MNMAWKDRLLTIIYIVPCIAAALLDYVRCNRFIAEVYKAV